MTETLDELLDEVRERGWELNPPAAPDALDRVGGWFLARTGDDLPAGYRTLLARTDGLDFNGAVVYATGDSRARGGVFVAGLAESNGRIGGEATWVAEANGDLFGLAGGDWVTAAKGSRAVLDRHDDCTDLLAHVIRTYLDA